MQDAGASISFQFGHVESFGDRLVWIWKLFRQHDDVEM
jgi:hypothetical protein